MSDNTGAMLLLKRQLVLDSNPDAIHMVESMVDEIKTELEFREDVYANVMVAVTEAVNNSILHGNKNDASKKIHLEFSMRNPYRLLVKVRDEGVGFDYESLPDPTAPENLTNIGGRGVFLMKQLSDELAFNDEGRTVEMTFNV